MSIVKSFSVGNGDMFYIRHNSSNFSIIDCCMTLENQEIIVNEIKSQSAGKTITRFLSTHPDEDHIRGLEYLDENNKIVNFYCVANKATKETETTDFKKYRDLRDSENAFHIFKGCKRKWMNEEDETNKSSGISILWPDVKNELYKVELAETEKGFSPNNISPIIQYQTGKIKILWMGDLETFFMENIAEEVDIPETTIVFAPHHGRDSGKIPDNILINMKPKIIVVGEAPSEHLHYYPDFNTLTQNSAGDITFDCDENLVHVYVSNQNYQVDFLDDYGRVSSKGKYYIGTLAI